MKVFCVYILKCNDGSYYAGMTSRIEQRLKEHHTGKFRECYTFRRRPLKLVYHQEFQDFDQAMWFEKKIKGWSRKKKQALIEERWDDLIKFSKNYAEYGSPTVMEPSTGSG